MNWLCHFPVKRRLCYGKKVASYRTNNTEYLRSPFLRDVIERQLLKIVETAKNKQSAYYDLLSYGIPDILQGDPLNINFNEFFPDSAMQARDAAMNIDQTKYKITKIINELSSVRSRGYFPEFENDPVGTTDQEGKRDIKVDTNYWFHWSLFGNSEEYVDKDREGMGGGHSKWQTHWGCVQASCAINKRKKKIIKVFLIPDAYRACEIFRRSRQGKSSTDRYLNSSDISISHIKDPSRAYCWTKIPRRSPIAAFESGFRGYFQ